MNIQKIAFLCHPYHKGGVTRWMADSAISLSNSGYNVYFITVEPKMEFVTGRGKETLLKLLGDEPNNIHIIKKKVGREFEFTTPRSIVHTFRKLILDGLEKGTPIIISDYDLIWEAASTVADQYPIIGVLHCDNSHYYDLGGKYAKKLSMLVSVSKRISNKVCKMHPSINSKTLFTIPCGVNLAGFMPVKRAETDILKLIFIGRFEAPEKRARDLIGICASLVKENIAFQLDIIGNSLKSQIEFSEYFKNVGAEKFVNFKGWLSKSEIEKILPYSDIFLLPSDCEGLPIVMMESLASGCGFVGSRVSGLEDYENYPLAENCYGIFAIGDFEDAVEKIKTIAQVPRQIRSVAARKFAETYFDIKVCMQRYLEAFESIEPALPPKSNYSFSFFDMVYSRSLSYARSFKLKLSKKNN